MKIDDKIQENLDKLTEDARKEEIQLINSPAGRTGTITLVQVRNMRTDILNSFKDLKNRLPLMIYTDIAIEADNDIDVIKKINNLQKELLELRARQGAIKNNCKHYNKQLKQIREGIKVKNG